MCFRGHHSLFLWVHSCSLFYRLVPLVISQSNLLFLLTTDLQDVKFFPNLCLSENLGISLCLETGQRQVLPLEEAAQSIVEKEARGSCSDLRFNRVHTGGSERIFCSFFWRTKRRWRKGTTLIEGPAVTSGVSSADVEGMEEGFKLDFDSWI